MPDLLLNNGLIWTGDDGAPWATDALIRDGRFVYVGASGEAPAHDGATIDAGGRLVVPGLVDAHAHLMQTGFAMQNVDLKGVESMERAVALVGERASRTAEGGWVRGSGWDQHLWPGAAFPTRHDLDAVAPDRPVALTHTSAHCVWANSAALQAAGVSASTEAPGGGRIERDGHGEPTGILLDTAQALIYDAMPAPTHDERVEALSAAVAHAHRLGLTGVHAMDVGRGELAALRALHDRGALTMRVWPYLSQTRLDHWIDEGVRTGDGDDVLRIGGTKFFADGALGSLTAWMIEPYEGRSDDGFPLQPVHELERRVRLSLEAGLAPAIHAIGDRANREVLDVVERLQAVASALPRRVEHAQLLTPEDSMRFVELGVTASMQPIHATQDYEKVDREWGERGSNAYTFASLLWTGANLAFGSDSPVETMDPIAGVHAAVTRRTASGEPPGGWYPDEAVPLEAALRAYTHGCAVATDEQDTLGRIAPGYLGDFVVLSDDLFALDDPMRILDAQVDVTVVGGEVVYER